MGSLGAEDTCVGRAPGLQVLVVDLDGRSLVRRVPGDLSVYGLRDLLVSVYPDVDSNWYLMFNGKLLSGGLLTELGVCETARITKKVRLRGGVNNSVPGSFFFAPRATRVAS